MAIRFAYLFLFAGVILVALPLPKDVKAAQPSTASILNAPEAAPPLSIAALSALLAVNVSSAFFPTDLTVKCDGPLRGTRHTVRCIGGYPVGGYVLEPPSPPDRAMLFLHGLSDVPTLHLTVLATLLGGDDAAAWQTARVLLPLAPVLPRLFRAPDAALRLPAGAVHAWFDISHTLPYQAVGALAGTTPAAVAASLVATGVVGDRLGLAASTRRLCAMALVQAAGDLGGGLPPVPVRRTAVVGHSLGGAMAWHAAVAARAPWAGVLALAGYLPLTPYYARFPEAAGRGGGDYTLTSVAADGDTVVAPALSAAAALVGGGVLGGGGASPTGCWKAATTRPF